VIAQDPHAYWEYLRSEGPVVREPHYGVVAVTGYQEVQAAFKDFESFSAVNAIGGPFPPLPFAPEGDDISDSSTNTVMSSPSSSTWSSWIRRSTRRRGRC
jgi:hypothetical protein